MYSKLSRTKFHTASIYKINLKRLNLNVDDQNASFCWCCLWNPLNVITLGQRGTDNIYWMITITSYFQAVMYWNLVNGTFEVLSSKQLITLSVITLSSFHCNILLCFCFHFSFVFVFIFVFVFQVESYETYANNTMKTLHFLKYLLGIDWTRFGITQNE